MGIIVKMLLCPLISMLESTSDFNDLFFGVSINLVNKRVRARVNSGWNID